jgi:hypothetical protein
MYVFEIAVLSVCPSLCPHISVQPPLDGYRGIWFVNLYENLSRHFVSNVVVLFTSTSKPRYVLLFSATGTCHKIFILQHLVLYVVDSDMYINNTRNALLLFHCKHGYVKALRCYVLRTLPVLFDVVVFVISYVLAAAAVVVVVNWIELKWIEMPVCSGIYFLDHPLI